MDDFEHPTVRKLRSRTGPAATRYPNLTDVQKGTLVTKLKVIAIDAGVAAHAATIGSSAGLENYLVNIEKELADVRALCPPPAPLAPVGKSIKVGDQWVDIPPEISALKDPLEPEFKTGDYVHVIDGPHTGSRGSVDFIDIEGKRALVNRGEDRHGGLAWIPLSCLRGRGPGLWG